LSVASTNETVDNEVRKRALVNSMVGTTMLVDFTTGDILGTKAIGEKETDIGTNGGYVDPGALLLSMWSYHWRLSAWAVSLASDGKTYASTGGSGSVTIHSALPSSEDMMDSDIPSFGTRLTDLPTGRSKFGLFVDHSPVDDNKIATSSETGQVSLNVLRLIPESLKQTWARYSYLIQRQPLLSILGLATQCPSVPLAGAVMGMYVKETFILCRS
jgi:hypothetical protein